MLSTKDQLCHFHLGLLPYFIIGDVVKVRVIQQCVVSKIWILKFSLILQSKFKSQKYFQKASGSFRFFSKAYVFNLNGSSYFPSFDSLRAVKFILDVCTNYRCHDFVFDTYYYSVSFFLCFFFFFFFFFSTFWFKHFIFSKYYITVYIVAHKK